MNTDFRYEQQASLHRCAQLMARTFLIFFLGTAVPCFAQRSEFKGHLAYKDGSKMGYGYLIFPLTKDTILIDSTGVISVDLMQPKHRLFYISNGDFRSRIYNFKSEQPADTVHRVTIPDSAYYAVYHKKKLCPICLQSKTVLPIEYGLPSPEMFKQAEKGKILLGGCIVYDDMPLFYCKKDDFSF